MTSNNFAVGVLPIACSAVACSPSTDTASESDTFPATAQTDAGLFHLELEHDPWPAVAGDARMHVRVMDAEAEMAPVLGASFTVEPWMPAHEHGTAEPPVVMEHGEGLYMATWAYSMPGAWQLNLHIEAEDGRMDAAQIDVEVQ